MPEIEVITATVDSNKDPAKAGRILVKIPQMDGDQYPEWIEPIWPPGSWICIPEPGDTVEILVPAGEDIVEFADDVRYLGKRYDDAHPVPSEFKTHYPYRRGFKTPRGHILILDDKAGSEEITIAHKGVLLISLTNAGIFIGSQAATEPLVLGNLWKSMESAFMGAFMAHVHATGVGPSGPPDPTQLGVVTALKAQVDANAQLSDFAWTQKVKP